MDFSGDADALALRFTAAFCPAPTVAGNVLPAIDSSTAESPNALGATPCCLVFLEDGDLVTGNGTRAGVIGYVVRFYYAEAADLARDARALLAWASVLIDALKGAAQLGGRVARAVVDSFTVGLVPYAGRTYSGIELKVLFTTSEAWGATA